MMNEFIVDGTPVKINRVFIESAPSVCEKLIQLINDLYKEKVKEVKKED